MLEIIGGREIKIDIAEINTGFIVLGARIVEPVDDFMTGSFVDPVNIRLRYWADLRVLLSSTEEYGRRDYFYRRSSSLVTVASAAQVRL